MAKRIKRPLKTGLVKKKQALATEHDVQAQGAALLIYKKRR